MVRALRTHSGAIATSVLARGAGFLARCRLAASRRRQQDCAPLYASVLPFLLYSYLLAIFSPAAILPVDDPAS
jgi:hypothetical protein